MKKRLFSFIFVFTICIFFSLNTSLCTAISNEPNESSSETSKVVYLTFDDGLGGKVTTEVLDTLKKYNVNATFFLIGNTIDGQENLLKRMASEGHSLGLHSYTHDKNLIYSSNENFLEEMLKSQKKIEEVTGVKSNILRFPFGCNNKCYRLNSSMVDLLHSNGLKIYDWTVDSTDGMNPYMEPYKIASKAKSKDNTAVVLMHCGYVNKNSSKALPSIIEYYKSNNYEFKIIDNSTEEVYRIRKNK